jgi:hypothetical protein
MSWQSSGRYFEIVNEGQFPEFYGYRFRLHAFAVEMPFSTDPYPDGERVAVWVEPCNTNGIIKHPGSMDQEYGYGAALPPSLSETPVGPGLSRLEGRIVSYVFAAHLQGGGNPFYDWWPQHPAGVYATVSTLGRFEEEPPPPSLPTAPTGLSGWFDSIETVVHLQWHRNPTSENVDYYWLECAEEEEDFEVIAKMVWDPGSGSWVAYDHHMLEPPGAEYLRYRVRAHNNVGWGPFCNPIEVPLDIGPLRAMDEAERIESVPKMLTLAANYPNPFNPDTQIRFGLPNSARVNLVIYNLRSQVVRVLVDQEMHAGWHMLRWDGKNEQNQDVASGIYLYILQTDGKRLLRKMMLIR